MSSFVTRCEEALVDLLNTRVQIIDSTENAIIGHRGQVVDVDWATSDMGPCFTVDRDCGAEHGAWAGDLSIIDSVAPLPLPDPIDVALDAQHR